MKRKIIADVVIKKMCINRCIHHIKYIQYRCEHYRYFQISPIVILAFQQLAGIIFIDIRVASWIRICSVTLVFVCFFKILILFIIVMYEIGKCSKACVDNWYFPVLLIVCLTKARQSHGVMRCLAGRMFWHADRIGFSNFLSACRLYEEQEHCDYDKTYPDPECTDVLHKDI